MRVREQRKVDERKERQKLRREDGVKMRAEVDGWGGERLASALVHLRGRRDEITEDSGRGGKRC